MILFQLAKNLTLKVSPDQISLPLPSFKYKIKMSSRIIYKLTENNKIAYSGKMSNQKKALSAQMLS